MFEHLQQHLNGLKREFRPGWRDAAALLALAAWALITLHPILSAGFVLVDDHEILALVPQVGSSPDVRPALDVRSMALDSDPSVGRFRPLYWTVRLGEVAAFGDNASLWHTAVLALGIASSAFLYGTARTLWATRVPALLLGAWLLVAPGVGSVWTRLGADDTLATFFLCLAVFAAARAARGGSFSQAWDVLFVLAATASVLSKEAFALAAIALAAFRALTTKHIGPAALAVGGLGIAETLVVFLIGASAGPLSYGGRYLAVPNVATYVRSLVQNAVILVYAGLGWLGLLVVWTLRSSLTDRCERRTAVAASAVALVLVVPQLALYSQQGIFEGKYEAAAAIGVAGWSMSALVWLGRRRQPQVYVAGLCLWSGVLLAFGFSTWTYAHSFTADSVQLARLVNTVAGSTGSGQTVGIAADPARQYEPIVSLVDHVVHQGRSDLLFRVVPLEPDRPYTPLEASFARAMASSNLSQGPSLTDVGCASLDALIILGKEAQTRATLPCLNTGFRRIEFSESVLLWGGEGVSLRPRLPGWTSVGYVLLVRAS